jgi:hypothetical protein
MSGGVATGNTPDPFDRQKADYTYYLILVRTNASRVFEETGNEREDDCRGTGSLGCRVFCRTRFLAVDRLRSAVERMG